MSICGGSTKCVVEGEWSKKGGGGGAHLCHVTKTTAVWTERATREELRQVGYRYFNRIHVLNSRLYKVVCILNIF